MSTQSERVLTRQQIKDTSDKTDNKKDRQKKKYEKENSEGHLTAASVDSV